jgi:hypothetical protein
MLCKTIQGLTIALSRAHNTVKVELTNTVRDIKSLVGPESLRRKRFILTAISCFIEKSFGACQNGADGATVRTALTSLDGRVSGLSTEITSQNDRIIAMSKITMKAFHAEEGKVNLLAQPKVRSLC